MSTLRFTAGESLGVGVMITRVLSGACGLPMVWRARKPLYTLCTEVVGSTRSRRPRRWSSGVDFNVAVQRWPDVTTIAYMTMASRPAAPSLAGMACPCSA